MANRTVGPAAPAKQLEETLQGSWNPQVAVRRQQAGDQWDQNRIDGERSGHIPDNPAVTVTGDFSNLHQHNGDVHEQQIADQRRDQNRRRSVPAESGEKQGNPHVNRVGEDGGEAMGGQRRQIPLAEQQPSTGYPSAKVSVAASRYTAINGPLKITATGVRAVARNKSGGTAT